MKLKLKLAALAVLSVATYFVINYQMSAVALDAEIKGCLKTILVLELQGVIRTNGSDDAKINFCLEITKATVE